MFIMKAGWVTKDALTTLDVRDAGLHLTSGGGMSLHAWTN